MFSGSCLMFATDSDRDRRHRLLQPRCILCGDRSQMAISNSVCGWSNSGTNYRWGQKFFAKFEFCDHWEKMNTVEAIKTYIAATHPTMTVIDITSTLDQKSLGEHRAYAYANPRVFLVGQVPPSRIKISNGCAISEPNEIMIICKVTVCSCTVFPEGAIDCTIEGEIRCCRCGMLICGNMKTCNTCGRIICIECTKLVNSCPRCGSGFVNCV